MAALLLLGCDKPDKPDQREGAVEIVEHWEQDGPRDCLVIIHSYRYAHDYDVPSIEVYWDGQQLFAGELPTVGELDLGLPARLIMIHTNPGPHVLEVRHGDNVQKQDVLLDEAQNQHYMLFGYDQEQQRRALIVDIGEKPLFR